MAKSEGQRAVISWSGSEIGVTDFTYDENISEQDVTDTETAIGSSEYLGSKSDESFSFSLFKDTTVADLTMNTSTALIISVFDADGASTTYTGNGLLLTKSVGGAVDGVVKVDYTGRWTGAVVEAQVAA